MMGRQDRGDQRQLFYEFSLDEMIPRDHLLRRINVFATSVLADLHQQLKGFYSEIGRPSIDPELMIRMLLVGYCYGIRHERRLCQEVALHLAYRWFCKLDLDDKVPHHSTFSVNRLGRFRESEILRHIFERVVAACMVAGLVKGEGFAVDASVMEANASRFHGKAPGELDRTDAQRQKRAVAEYLAGLEPRPRSRKVRMIVVAFLADADCKKRIASRRKRSRLPIRRRPGQRKPTNAAVRIPAQLSHRSRARNHCRR